MKEIVKVLLEKGLDENTIHEVLNVLEAGVDIPDFVKQEQEEKARKERIKQYEDRQKAKEAAKEYGVKALTNLRQNVKRGKNTTGPTV